VGEIDKKYGKLHEVDARTCSKSLVLSPRGLCPDRKPTVRRRIPKIWPEAKC
jgi:hypothetical protein